MALNIPLAIRLTPYYAETVGWRTELPKVCALLGYPHHYPDARGFVVALSRWQARYQLDADGMLGQDTWKKMKPALPFYVGPTPGMGPHPKWVYQIDPSANVQPLPPARDVVLRPSQASSEDRVIKEMIAVTREEKDSLLPIAVSPAYLARNGYPTGNKVLNTNGVISRFLQVGQEWKGLEGKRLIAGLSGGFYGSVVHSTMPEDGTVLFVTESGQAYEQRLTGWEEDLKARMFADTAEALKPLQKMLDVELAFLNAAQAAYNFPLYVAVHGGAFYLEHHDKIPLYIAVAYALYKLRGLLKEKAPNLYDKVFWAILKRVWGKVWDELWENPSVNLTATAIAKFVAKLIVTRGKSFFADAAKTSAEALLLLVKQLTKAVAVLLATNLATEAAKNAAKNELHTVRDIIDVLRKLGAAVSEVDLKNIAAEFQANERAIMPLLTELKENVEKL